MPSGSKKEYKLRWADVEQALTNIQLQMSQDKYVPTTIVGIARGGMIPAAMLAMRLGVHDVQSLRLQNHDVVCIPLSRFTPNWNNDDILFVDDILDSGWTCEYLKRWYPRARGAILFTKHIRLPGLDPYVGTAVPPDKWAVFPWDVKTTTQPTSEFQL